MKALFKGKIVGDWEVIRPTIGTGNKFAVQSQVLPGFQKRFYTQNLAIKWAREHEPKEFEVKQFVLRNGEQTYTFYTRLNGSMDAVWAGPWELASVDYSDMHVESARQLWQALESEGWEREVA